MSPFFLMLKICTKPIHFQKATKKKLAANYSVLKKGTKSK